MACQAICQYIWRDQQPVYLKRPACGMRDHLPVYLKRPAHGMPSRWS